ncbi:hypothetical protein BCV69DRAFT_130999 [Microstroma glucosiphilum]|uniref:Uncharacterized protein n=1 Tax=Pseudomicrostroma glucosiphilum TaxID=1684307 RepID=A0A316TWF8_9BASI|nr:hypothetical protein BCV69DRAFT_130999 [Pseudomicrostroma glucosiphilum]PWN17667.1 hypothetical protein BCV69DRAFT_130999 [Pseudomicrostroma glucosiphilum]
MDIQKEDCWVVLRTNALPHLRSYLRDRPNFDPAGPLECQKGLGEKWAKEFWDQEKGPPWPQWLNAWTAIWSQSGSQSSGSTNSQEKLSDSFTEMIEGNGDVQDFPEPDDSIFSDEDEDEDEEDKLHVTTGTHFVASASTASDRDLRGMLSGKKLKLYENMLVSREYLLYPARTSF